MSTSSFSEDVKVEVSGGYLLVAFKIPTLKCDVCGRTVAKEVVDLDRARTLLNSHNSIEALFGHPAGWSWVYSKLRQPLLACPDCFSPIAAVRELNEEAEAAVREAVAAKVKGLVTR